MNLTQYIKEDAAACGFDLASVAPVEPEKRDVAFLREWLAEGKHGEMSYLENPKKNSLRDWWPEAKSVVMVGLFYQAQTQVPKPGEGRIASYAVYPEYQKRMKKMLKEFLRRIQRHAPEVDGRLFADTSPVLERAYARLSGMGWIGKNTMLIHPRKGSFFFLGGLALNVELPLDQPQPDHCGSCRRCIDACPTQALTPYQMNASRCISYLTIERRSETEYGELEQKMGNWIFGCDICQEVCPFNKKPLTPKQGGSAEGLDWRPLIPNTISLQTLLSWNEAEFKTYFKGTPVLRAKWKGMRRNATIAARNIHR